MVQRNTAPTLAHAQTILYKYLGHPFGEPARQSACGAHIYLLLPMCFTGRCDRPRRNGDHDARGRALRTGHGTQIAYI